MKSEILYMGHKLYFVVISPFQNKIYAIALPQLQTTDKDLRLFLGKITYCSKFLYNFVILTYWLIYSINTAWYWVSEHKQALDAIKQLLLHSKTFV